MAKLYISEYASLGKNGVMALSPAVVTQTPVAIAGASAQSAAFGAGTNYIRVHTDAICSITVGANPTATTDNMRLAANQTEYFTVTPGHKLAVIANT